jgi:hypothetical protein
VFYKLSQPWLIERFINTTRLTNTIETGHGPRGHGGAVGNPMEIGIVSESRINFNREPNFDDPLQRIVFLLFDDCALSITGGGDPIQE